MVRFCFGSYFGLVCRFRSCAKQLPISCASKVLESCACSNVVLHFTYTITCIRTRVPSQVLKQKTYERKALRAAFAMADADGSGMLVGAVVVFVIEEVG